MLLATLCFAVFPPRVSINIPGLPVPQAVAEIAKASNHTLVATTDLKIDIVCIKATDVPLDELKAQIAKATGSEWVQREGHQVLTRSNNLERIQEQEEIASKADEIAEIIASMPVLPDFTESEAIALVQQAQAIVDRMDEGDVTEEGNKARLSLLALLDKAPARRMLDRMLHGLDPKLLASVRLGQPMVFSNFPTKMQHSLPVNLVQTATREYEREQSLFRRMVLRHNSPSYRKPSDVRFWSWDSDPQFHKIFIKVEMHRSTGMPRITLKLADRANQTQSVSTMLFRRPTTPATQIKQWEGDIELSPKALDWKRLFYRLISTSNTDSFTGKPMHQVLAPWLDIHCNPETFEPLSFAVGDSMQRFADTQSKNIVACLPEMGLIWYDAESSRLSAQSFANFAERSWNGRFETSGSWLIYRPRYFSEGRRYRISRDALGQLFRGTRARSGLTIDEAAKYAYAVSSPLLFESWDRTVTAYGERFDGEFSTSGLVDWFNRGALRLIGSLSPSQRKSVISGGSVAIAEMSASARQELQAFTFGDQKSTRGLLGRLYWARDELNPAEIRGTLDYEATEVFGSGIPSGTVLKGLSETKDMLVQTFLGEHPYTQTFSPLGLGEYLVYQEDAATSAKYQYQLGTAKHLTFTVDYGESRLSHDEFSEVSGGQRVTFTDWRQLPATIRSQIEGSMKAAKDRKSKQENQSGAVPPP